MFIDVMPTQPETPSPDPGGGPSCSPAEQGCFHETVRAGPAVFSALQERLGLKLDARQSQVDVLVVDRAERPTAN